MSIKKCFFPFCIVIMKNSLLIDSLIISHILLLHHVFKTMPEKETRFPFQYEIVSRKYFFFLYQLLTFNGLSFIIVVARKTPLTQHEWH